jgi:hypothetical protein
MVCWCGDANVYIGFQKVECSNPECEHYGGGGRTIDIVRSFQKKFADGSPSYQCVAEEVVPRPAEGCIVVLDPFLPGDLVGVSLRKDLIYVPTKFYDEFAPPETHQDAEGVFFTRVPREKSDE